MRRKGLFLWTVTLAFFLISFSLLSQPHLAQAACGCLKPPPEPATVIPNMAVPGLPITLFHDSFQAEQWWNVVFESWAAGKKANHSKGWDAKLLAYVQHILDTVAELPGYAVPPVGCVPTTSHSGGMETCVEKDYFCGP